MSTCKTENYQLHAWGAEDEESLGEINENFGKLDGASRVIAGTYVGDGETEQSIDLGFTPKAVLVIHPKGEMSQSYSCYGGLALPGFPAIHDLGGIVRNSIALTETGFTVFYSYHGSYSVCTNGGGYTYYYLAVR